MSEVNSSRRELVLASLAIAVGSTLPGGADAQAFPAKPIRLICPWPAGGANDAVMRVIAESASKILGGTMLVENKRGATGMLGPHELVKAAPDGYTLSQLTIGVARLPYMQKMQFDPLKDFTYVACLTGHTFGLVVRSDSPIKSIKDLVEFARANPDRFTYRSPGTGTTPHLAVEEFASCAGIKMTHIPYEGAAEGVQALLGGHVMSHTAIWAPQVDAGNLRLLATYCSKRAKRYANVSTLAELGYETISDSPFGLGGPKGMDPELTRRLHDVFRKTLDDPVLLASLKKYDQSVIYMNTADSTKFIADQYVKEKGVIERLGLAIKT